MPIYFLTTALLIVSVVTNLTVGRTEESKRTFIKGESI